MALEAREIRELTPDELLRKLDEAQRELFTLRLKVSGQTPNTAKIRGLRRDVARLKTVLTEKGGRVRWTSADSGRRAWAWSSATRWTRPRWCGSRRPTATPCTARRCAMSGSSKRTTGRTRPARGTGC